MRHMAHSMVFFFFSKEKIGKLKKQDHLSLLCGIWMNFLSKFYLMFLVFLLSRVRGLLNVASICTWSTNHFFFVFFSVFIFLCI